MPLQLSGSLNISGSIITETIVISSTSSFAGTASWSETALTSSYPIWVTGSTIYSTAPSAGQVNPDNSIFLGYYAGGASTNASNTIAVGNAAGANAPNSFSSVFLGYSAGNGATDAFDAVFIGNAAGTLAYQAAESIFIGTSAGGDAYTASYSAFIGYSAGLRARSASYSTLIGYRAGAADAYGVDSIGSNNIVIGNNVSLEYGRQDSINIAGLIFATGSYRNLDEIFYDGAHSGSANGKVGVNQPLPQYSLDVSGSIGLSDVLVLATRNTLPAIAPTGSIMVSGSGANLKPYFWNGATWTSLI